MRSTQQHHQSSQSAEPQLLLRQKNHIYEVSRMKGTSYSVFTLGSYFGRLRQHDDKRTKPLLRDPL